MRSAQAILAAANAARVEVQHGDEVRVLKDRDAWRKVA